ncbi:uncharacterized protein B0H18DRAFT_959593 [Fomitopsis serialis]|uniref:uncharacterized protein n=1 Tax=Fomitopsis serialis TaxID=139415 RepID=UPI0020078DF7|nr:uncharacterized protein B0H18DRAFT_959593 [Neoantrodia serialis]KAH9914857.1 hypothetical protein B0H18DRAFT_959593 [Neoantrodia serialis]
MGRGLTIYDSFYHLPRTPIWAPLSVPKGEAIFWDFSAVNGALRIFVSIPANESAPKSLLSDRSRRQAGIPACRRLRFGSGRLTERLVSDNHQCVGSNETIIDTLIEGQLVKCHQIMSAEPLGVIYWIDVLHTAGSTKSIWGIFRILLRSQCRRYSATKEPVAGIQTQLKTSAACLIRVEKGLVAPIRAAQHLYVYLVCVYVQEKASGWIIAIWSM